MDRIHYVLSTHLKELVNPFTCWADLIRPITLADIAKCIVDGEEELTDTPFSWKGNEPNEENSKKHIAKIAWFVKYGYNDPIELDVGVPELNCYVDYIVQDGNHRLASSIYREVVQGIPSLIPCSISGSLTYAEELLKLNKIYP